MNRGSVQLQSKIASRSNKLDKILVVRLSAMGDVIHALPAVYLLRRTFPSAHLGWLIEERWAELLCSPASPRRGARSAGRPLVDQIHAVNLKRWRRGLFSISTAEKIATVWNDIRALEYDAAIDLQGAIRSAMLASWSGATEIYGAAQTREAPANLWYTRNLIASGKHVIDENISLISQIANSHRAGRPVNSPADPISPLPSDLYAESQVSERLEGWGINQFLMLNPGGGWGAKRWPAERYAELARALRSCGWFSIVNYGPGEEELANSVEKMSEGAAHAMRTSITELIALTRRASLFISGDTGPLHLAAALGVPVVGIYGPTDPARNGPYATRSIVLRSPESITSHKRKTKPDGAMLEISADEVFSAAKQILIN